jgi:hypothetical protein
MEHAPGATSPLSREAICGGSGITWRNARIKGMGTSDGRGKMPLRANLAIEPLIRAQRIGSEPVTIVDKSDKEFRARLDFVRSFQ